MDAIYSNYFPTFLYAEKYSFSEKWVYPSSYVPYSMLRYIYSGSARFEIDGKSYEVCADDVFHIPEGCMLYCEAHEKLVFVSIRFIGSLQLPGEDMLKHLWNIAPKNNFRDQKEMKELFEKIYHCAISRNTYKRLETRGYLNLICANLAKRAAANEENEGSMQFERTMMESMFDMKYIRHRNAASQKKIDPRIQNLVDYLMFNPEKKVTRKEMCEICNIGESTLRRLFKKQMGKTIYEFVYDLKMSYASHLLVTTSEPISEIGYQLGFESPSYFSKSFRNVYGISPQDYRRQSREA